MRKRGPRFAWWVIPAVLGIAMLLGMALKLAFAPRYVDAKDIATPPGLESSKLHQGGVDRFTLYREFPVLARWADKEAVHSGGLAVGRLDDVRRVDDELVTTIERKQRERAGTKFETHTARVDNVSGRPVARLEFTDGDQRLRLAILRIGAETILLVADSSERDDTLEPPFTQMLDSLLRLQPRRREVTPFEAGQAAGRGFVVGLVFAFPVAFFVSVRQRRAWEQAELERAAPGALAAGPPPAAPKAKFVWPIIPAGLALGAIIGGLVGAHRSAKALVEGADIQAPAGYQPTSKIPGDKSNVVLAGWTASSGHSVMWVSRTKDPIARSGFGGDEFFAGIEKGMRDAAGRQHVSVDVKKRETRQVAGRTVYYLEAEVAHGAILRNAGLLVERSELFVSAAMPTAEADEQRPTFDAMIDQLARLEPHPVGPADRYVAEGEDAATGLMVAILPSIGLAAVFRRRR